MPIVNQDNLFLWLKYSVNSYKDRFKHTAQSSKGAPLSSNMNKTSISLTHLVNPLTDFGFKMVMNDRIETSHDFSNQVTDFYHNDQLKLTNQKDVFAANYHC